MRSPNRHVRFVSVATFAIVSLGAPACGDDDDDSSPVDAGLDGGRGPRDGGSQDGRDAQVSDAGMLTDGEIINVMLTANSGEIQEGQLAMSRAVASEVKTFANRMVTDHGAANAMVNALAQNNPIPPVENALSRQLAAESMKEINRLEKLTGGRFDRVYMQAQVEDHMQVLDIIDKNLLPQVQSSTLLALLQSMRTTVQEHLMMAQSIVGDLEADGGAEDGGT